MDAEQLKSRMQRIETAFDNCLGGGRELSRSVFKVFSFQLLIGETFTFFHKDDLILHEYIAKPNNRYAIEEALIGKVTGIEFNFCIEGIDVPAFKDAMSCMTGAKKLSDIAGQTCRPTIQTTIGELSPPWDINIPWMLDTLDKSIHTNGDVIFY